MIEQDQRHIARLVQPGPAAYRCIGIAVTAFIKEGSIVDLGSRRFAVFRLSSHSPAAIGRASVAIG